MSGHSDLINGMDYQTFFSLIDNMHDEVIVYDHNYKIVYLNRAGSRHYSCPPEEMIGRSFFDFVGENEWWAPSILPIVYEQKKGYAIRQKTKTNCELLTVAVPLFDEHEELKFVVMNVQDNLNDIELYNPHYISSSGKQDADLIPVVESREMKDLLALVERVSLVDATCILTGESGSGKTLIAQYMHSISPRRDRPFVNLNCASIPDDLIESELFGYVKGAFSGASSSGKKGLISVADTGTLLLDEISELSMAAQAKLLNVIQDREFLPVGAIKPVKVDVKIIAATNKNLQNMMAIGTFREDLFYRINVIDIYIPPLRKRREDIRPLIKHFLDYFNTKYKMSKKLSENAVKILYNYEWKGNVRELRHLIERILVTTAVEEIDETHLPKHVFGIVDHSPTESPAALPESYQEEMERYEADLIRRVYKQCGSSRKVSELLSISQTKANNLIRKYL